MIGMTIWIRMTVVFQTGMFRTTKRKLMNGVNCFYPGLGVGS